MKWLELCIDTARDGLDKLEAMLSALGIDGIEIEDEADFQSFLAGNRMCIRDSGDTVVLVCATASAKPRDGIDFFPLSVDFEEKMYSVGRIPGSFLRREGRPGEKGVLTSRVIDRPIRPLFPGDFRNDVSIMATVMSVDHD